MSLTDLSTWDVLVGKVTGRWDKASLKVIPQDASRDRFKAGSKLCVDVKGQRRVVGVLSSRRQGKHFICDCSLANQDEAEALINATLWVHRSMRPALPDGEFYLDEVLGLRVVTEAGVELGEIEEVLESPAHNIYVTKTAMIPVHKEFIVSTDWKERVLTVRDVPGLKQDEL